MKHIDILNEMEQLAAYEFKEDWDPTGPALGDLQAKTNGVVLSLDLTYQALQLALENHCNLIISHHPFLFSPIQQIMADCKEQALLLDLMKHEISYFSAHTNLDIAEKGVAVTFMKQSLQNMDYALEGILLPNELNPKIGHGRIVKLQSAVKLKHLMQEIEHNLQTVCQVNTDRDVEIKRIAFTPGSFDESWIEQLEALQVDLLVTGEIKHHVSVMLYERNITLLAVGHGASEQTIIPFLNKHFTEKFPELNFVENPGIVYNHLRSE